MLQALPSVIQKFPKALVLLVGETYASEAVYARQLRQTIGAMGLEKHVRFWGFERDIAKIHAMSDTLILCTENEPFGRSILEALAMGVPVVLPNRGGFTEIIRHGANGLLYDASDARSLSGALMNILFDANLRAKLAAAGRETIQSLDIATHVREVSQIYEDLLK